MKEIPIIKYTVLFVIDKSILVPKRLKNIGNRIEISNCSKGENIIIFYY